MGATIHITNGDCAGDGLKKSGIEGEVLVWNDLLYDGRRSPGWPDDQFLDARAAFLQATTGGALDKASIRSALEGQYMRLARVTSEDRIVLWFDACLCDQAALVHILACLIHLGLDKAELLCVEAFAGIPRFNGLGQLLPGQLASLHGQQRPVLRDQFDFAVFVDRAFATQDLNSLADLAVRTDAPLPWITAAAGRWLEEQPDPHTGLGKLERLALQAVGDGSRTPGEIFAHVAAADTPPQYWGDTILWQKINGLARRVPPLVNISGPAQFLPQWESPFDLKDFRITLA